MLIRNVKSFADLEKKKNLQAQILQVQIDNENVLEGRVKDYQNPNKPPPVPPQYKTNAELAQDTNLQQREVINNLLTISGVENFLALGVSQELSQLPNGVGNYLIFNKNFPVIKKRLEDINKSAYSVSSFMKIIEEVLEQIDLGIFYQSTGGRTAQSAFNQAIGASTVIPSGQPLASVRANPLSSDYGKLLNELYQIRDAPASQLTNEPDFIQVIIKVEKLCDNSPEKKYLAEFDLIEQLERKRLQSEIDRLIYSFGLPSYREIVKIANDLDPAVYISASNQAQLANNPVLPESFQRAYARLKAVINGIKNPDKTISDIGKLKDKLQKLLGGQVAVQQQLMGQLTQAQQQAQQAQAQLLAQQQQQAQQLIQDTADKQITRDKINAFISPPLNRTNLEERLITLGTLKAGLPQIILPDGTPKTVFDNWSGKVGIGWVNRGAQSYSHPTDDELLTAGFQGGYQNIQVFLEEYLKKRDIGSKNATGNVLNRYKEAQLLGMLQTDIQGIQNRLNTDPTFIPERNAQQRIVGTQGFGIQDYIKKTQVMCPAVYDPVMGKDGKMYNNKCQASTSGAGMPKPDTIHIDINSHNGENYKMSGDGFISRKIKIGKGIEVQEQPRYKTFGKYIVHIPHLENDNVLNFKFPSMGSIPTLKPVSVDDNFKEFIIDILNTGKVNQRHYDTLTEPEKEHFNKVIKGAGLSNSLQFKIDNKIDEKKDIKRLDILLGEINAGNDNEKLRKECKDLIKKCVNNGSLSKHKGMDFLLQIE